MRAVPERALAWLVCLSALVFATPFSPIADDPYPHLAGAGWAVLLALPLALVVLWKGTPLRGAWPFLLSASWAVLSWGLARLTDTFEARRALCIASVLPLAFVGGAALGANGRRTFERILLALSCVWTGTAIVQGITGSGWTGVLGDTGSLSQAALGGAALGAAWLATASGPRRAAGGVALALFLVHCAAAPVLAGSHTLLAALLLAAWRGRGPGRGALLALGLVALLAPFAGMAARTALTGDAAPIEGAQAEAAHSLGGLGVRSLVWRAALGLVADAPVLGAGPGQFQAAFPVHRDPREIELSRHGICSELDTEVEHAHNDWLQGFCELGLVGGACFALGLVLAARSAFAALAERERLPAATAALALLVNSFVHAPFLANPAAGVLAFALFGTLSSARAAPRADSAGRIAAVPVLLSALLALPLVKHGRALVAFVHANRMLAEDASARLDGGAAAERARDALRAAIAAASEAAPDAAPARILAARAAPDDPAAWDRVLEVRPNAVEAWEQSATEHARLGHCAEARARYQRALALSPTHPRILRNYARLELTQGELEPGLATVERLRSAGCLAAGWLESLGSELVLVLGQPGRGARVLFSRSLAELVPEELHASARDPDAAGTGEARECLAQLLWAREHAERGAFDVALRNYRQAAERSLAAREAARDPAGLYTLETAAAESRTGRSAEAAQRARGVALERATWLELAPWARDALLELGLRAPE